MGSLRTLLACFGRDAGSVVEGGGNGPAEASGGRAQGRNEGCGECHIQDIRRMLQPIDLALAGAVVEKPSVERPHDLQEALERNATPRPQDIVQQGMQLALEPLEGASAGARPWVWVPAASFDALQSPSRSPEEETECFFESLLESHRERQRHLNDTLDTGLSEIGSLEDVTSDYEDENPHISASCVFPDPGFGFLDGGAFQDDRELLDGGEAPLLAHHVMCLGSNILGVRPQCSTRLGSQHTFLFMGARCRPNLRRLPRPAPLPAGDARTAGCGVAAARLAPTADKSISARG